MNPSPAPTENVRFPSFAALRAAHRDLLLRRRDTGETPELLAEIKTFIERGGATGALIDLDDDRWAAQSLLDFWANTLHHQGIAHPDPTLIDFDPTLAPELPDSLCPYLGLDAFDEADREKFFGREVLVDAMVARLREHRFLAVVGSSGSGKSSVVLAGLLPRLKTGALPGSEGWLYPAPVVPGADPLAALARLAAGLANDPETRPAHPAIELTQSPTTLRTWLAAHGEAPALLVIDQFEEVFTRTEDKATRQAFIENLLELARAPAPPHRVVVTMRTDFEDAVARISALQALFEQSQVRLAALNAGQLRDAIEKPAALVGLKFEEGLVDELVREVVGEPAALPLLQFTLLKLWENRERNRLTWEAYRRLGGGRQALARSADALYNSLIPEEQVTARRILLRLVRPGEGLEVTSNRVPVEDLYKAGEARDRVERVLQRLAGERLLRLTRRADQAGNTVEVAHEALVRNWPRLVGWLDEERVRLRRRLRLSAAADQWVQLNRDPSALWRGAQLAEATEYEDLNTQEAAFVQASREAEQSERERELAQARALAEEQRRRAEEQTRASKNLRILAGFLGLALILVVSLSVLSAYQTREATVAQAKAEVASTQALEQQATAESASTQAIEQQAIAEAANTEALEQQATAEFASTQALEQQATAEFASTEALDQKATAEFEATRAIEQSQLAATAQAEALAQASLALSRQLAAQARIVLPTNQELALLLAREAYRASDTVEARSILLDALQNSLARTVVPVGVPIESSSGFIYSLAFAPDGKSLAFGTTSGDIEWWGINNQKMPLQPPSRSGTVYSVAFHPSGALLASGSTDGMIQLWDTNTGQIVGALRDDAKPWVIALDFSPDGRLLASARDDGKIVVWDVAARKIFHSLPEAHGGAGVWDVAFSPDSTKLVSGGNDETVRIWDATRGSLLKVLTGHTDVVRSVDWSPDGRWLASGSKDNTVIFWKWDGFSATISGEPLPAIIETQPNLLEENRVFGISFSRDSKLLAAATADKTVLLWEVATHARSEALPQHKSWVIDVAFSPASNLLASGSIDRTVLLREIAVQRSLDEELRISGSSVSALAAVADTLLGAGLRGREFSVWAYAGGVQESTERLPGPFSALAFGSFKGIPVVVSGDEEGTVRIWDTTSASFIGDRLETGTRITSLALSPEGGLVAVGMCAERELVESAGEPEVCSRNEIQLWDLASSTLLGTLTGHVGTIASLAFSPDGKWLASGSEDGAIILWDVAGLVPAGLPFSGFSKGITSLAFDPQGTLLASGGRDGSLVLWEVATHQAIGTPLTSDSGGITALAFSADGHLVYAGTDRGTVAAWDVDYDSWLARACELVGRNLSLAEWQQFLGEQPYRRSCAGLPPGEGAPANAP